MDLRGRASFKPTIGGRRPLTTALGARLVLDRKFDVFADYFQFLLLDEASDDDFSILWTERALEIGVAVGQTAASFGTLRNVTVPVEIRLLAADPGIDAGEVDHLSSGYFEVPTGRLVVMGCTDYLPDAPRIEIPSGGYRFSYAMRGIESITYESDPADDSYTVYMWPGSRLDPLLHKHWKART